MPRQRNNLALFEDDRAGTIYRTAARIIHEKGFAGTSMNEIAEAVDLTKPGLYYYVKGKKALLFAITSFAMDLLDAEVIAVAEQVAEPEARLRTIVTCHAMLLMREPGALGILIDEVDGLEPEQKATIIGRKRRYLDFVRETLEALRAAGRLRAVDPTVAAFSLLGMVMWISRWYQGEGRLDSQAVADDIAQIALGAVLPDRARGALGGLPPGRTLSFLPSAAERSEGG